MMKTKTNKDAARDAGQFLGESQLRTMAPAIFAKSCDPEVTDKYQFVSTENIINRLVDNYGMRVVSAKQCMLTQKNPIWGFHEVRLEAIERKMVKGLGEQIRQQVVIANSHDRSRRFMIMGGFFRLICTNGLIAPVVDENGEELAKGGRSLHLKSLNIDAMIENAFKSLDAGETLIKRMMETTMTAEERNEFAFAALKHVYGKTYVRKYAAHRGLFLTPRRKEDEGNDVWHTFNRLQENIIKGGIKLPSGRHTRPLGSGPHAGALVQTRFNEFMWSEAVNYLN